jgi:hypothetical protein
VLSQVKAFRSISAFVPGLGRLKSRLWSWLEGHWNVVSVLLSLTVAGVLVATAALPPLLAPFVLGPLGAVVVSALIAPKGRAG